MKKIILPILIWFSLATGAFAQYDPKALEILDQMSEKYKKMASFTASLTFSLTNEMDGINEEFKGKITVKDKKFRLVLDEQEIINDGKTIWTYLPSVQEVTINFVDPENDEMNPSRLYTMYKKGYKYLYLEDEIEKGKPCYVIDLIPERKDAEYFKIRLNIAKDNKNLQSWVLFDKLGNRYSYAISKFTDNVKIEDSFFTFNIVEHPNTEVVDLR